MKVFPKIICSSVVRSSQQGDSHGGLYLVDLDKMSFEQVVDWNEEQIDWEGMGGERGLRGIAFYNQKIICATSSQLLFFDQEFNLLNIYTNKYLSGCHEICVEANTLFITSTDFDSILEFDLQTNKFISAYFYRVITFQSK